MAEIKDEKMNGVFIAFENLEKFSGISKKIISQVQGLEQNGDVITLINIPNDSNGNKIGFRTNSGNYISRFSKNLYDQKISWRCDFTKLIEYILDNKIHFIYIRYIHFANPFFINFLKKLKKENIYILLEIPTFPYDLEYKNVGLSTKISLFVEKTSRKKFKQYVNKIVTFSNDNYIFGTPTLQISNGVNTEQVNLKKDKLNSNSIDIIAVGSIAFWHGYDRLIKGLYNYYKENKNHPVVVLNIVGDSDNFESRKYKSLVSEYGLEKYVKFYGQVFGNDLDLLFDKSNFAVGSLGIHRKGITNNQTIKNREYCARGIPFIYSEIDKDFEGKDFILKASADECPIDINIIVDFLQNKTIDSRELRDYATNNLTWKIQMEKVLNTIKLKV